MSSKKQRNFQCPTFCSLYDNTNCLRIIQWAYFIFLTRESKISLIFSISKMYYTKYK